MNSINEIELISFKICPFVQRTIVVAKEKNIDLKVTFIDLANKPDWFLKLSPFGKVPVLRVGEQAIFESSIIMDFLDEMTEERLRVADPLQNAVNRSWIDFSNDLIMNQFHYFRSANAKQLEIARTDYIKGLERVEQVMSTGPYFNGSTFHLIDAAFAPLFKRQEIVEKISDENPMLAFPKISYWGKQLLKRASVQKSIGADFEPTFVSLFRSMGAILLKPGALLEMEK